MNIGDVLSTNYGTKSWKLTSPDDYSALEWYDASEKPTEEQLRNELSILENEEPMRLLRIHRDTLLKETDWTQLKDINLDIIRERDWKNYRQALRDLPAKSNPKLTESGKLDMSSISWPDKPST